MPFRITCLTIWPPLLCFIVGGCIVWSWRIKNTKSSTGFWTVNNSSLINCHCVLQSATCMALVWWMLRRWWRRQWDGSKSLLSMSAWRVRTDKSGSTHTHLPKESALAFQYTLHGQKHVDLQAINTTTSLLNLSFQNHKNEYTAVPAFTLFSKQVKFTHTKPFLHAPHFREAPPPSTNKQVLQSWNHSIV